MFYLLFVFILYCFVPIYSYDDETKKTVKFDLHMDLGDNLPGQNVPLHFLRSIISQLNTAVHDSYKDTGVLPHKRTRDERQNMRFSDFLQKSIGIIREFEDSDLKEFVEVLSHEIQEYNYEDWEFHEPVDKTAFRRFIYDSLHSIHNASVHKVRRFLNNAYKKLEENHSSRFRNAINFVNSLYNDSHSEKMEDILSDLRAYKDTHSDRRTKTLKQIIRKGLRVLLLDHFVSMPEKSKLEVKQQVLGILHAVEILPKLLVNSKTKVKIEDSTAEKKNGKKGKHKHKNKDISEKTEEEHLEQDANTALASDVEKKKEKKTKKRHKPKRSERKTKSTEPEIRTTKKPKHKKKVKTTTEKTTKQSTESSDNEETTLKDLSSIRRELSKKPRIFLKPKVVKTKTTPPLRMNTANSDNIEEEEVESDEDRGSDESDVGVHFTNMVTKRTKQTTRQISSKENVQRNGQDPTGNPLLSLGKQILDAFAWNSRRNNHSESKSSKERFLDPEFLSQNSGPMQLEWSQNQRYWQSSRPTNNYPLVSKKNLPPPSKAQKYTPPENSTNKGKPNSSEISWDQAVFRAFDSNFEIDHKTDILSDAEFKLLENANVTLKGANNSEKAVKDAYVSKMVSKGEPHMRGSPGADHSKSTSTRTTKGDFSPSGQHEDHDRSSEAYYDSDTNAHNDTQGLSIETHHPHTTRRPKHNIDDVLNTHNMSLSSIEIILKQKIEKSSDDPRVKDHIRELEKLVKDLKHKFDNTTANSTTTAKAFKLRWSSANSDSSAEANAVGRRTISPNETDDKYDNEDEESKVISNNSLKTDSKRRNTVSLTKDIKTVSTQAFTIIKSKTTDKLTKVPVLNQTLTTVQQPAAKVIESDGDLNNFLISENTTKDNDMEIGNIPLKNRKIGVTSTLSQYNNNSFVQTKNASNVSNKNDLKNKNESGKAVTTKLPTTYVPKKKE